LATGLRSAQPARRGYTETVPGFHIENFGCRAARADGEAISDRLRAAGHCIEQPPEAELIVVNTCSVTAEADREARAYIRRAHRLNPAARIVVTGCYAQRAPEELAGLEGVSAVVGNSHKAFAPEIASALAAWEGAGFRPYIMRAPESSRASAPEGSLVPVHALLTLGGTPIFADDRFAHSFLEDAQVVPGSQTRPNLKIQEGCSNRCTFCVIPQTRGPSRSLTADAVLRQVRGFVAAGGNELVLSGINLGRWGRDFDPTHSYSLARLRMGGAPASGRASLANLVRAIFRETDLPRLRLSSIEPMDWNEELLALLAEFGGTRLARHAHLPLQSGSDAVLRRMHRRYRPWHYAEKVSALVRATGPELTLGADVMAGFPGETDAEFEETLQFIRALPFGYLHLFKFSPRPGTRGWALHAASPVKPELVEERMKALRALAKEKMRAHREQFLGCALEAVTLHTSDDLAARGKTRALSENFLPVEIEGTLDANHLARVRVTGLNAELTLEATAQVSSGVPTWHEPCLTL
jgi:threonylcarbamoyladenosine tRNA methylthiotransferase MtaB